jgi:hypothetical protein
MKRSLPTLLAALSLFGVCVRTLPAEARTIGLVFDDSGSMKENIQLPTFGVQLLVSTLDGREGRDRLFSIRLSQFLQAFPAGKVKIGNQTETGPNFGMQPGEVRADNVKRIFDAVRPGASLVTTHNLRTADRITGTINQIRSDWPVPQSSTPYEPVEVMLEFLARETREGEQAYLVVVTDGAFYDGAAGTMPSPDVLRASYEAYKRRMKGPLEILFLFMDGNVKIPGQTKTHAEVAREQQVFTQLMEVFGGDPRENAPFVRGFEQLKDALVRFVAKISATEVDRAGTVTRRDGNAIELDVPFSVTRIISLGIGSEASPPPRATPKSFTPAGTLQFEPSMAKGDNADNKLLNWPTTRLVGQVSQFLMEPALGPGKNRVEYSGPVSQDVVLLFRTEIGLRWKLIDDGGREIRPPDGGSIDVTRGRKYKLVVEIQDRIASTVPVLPSRLNNAVVTTTIAGPNSPVHPTLTPSDADKGYVGEVVFPTEGKHTIDTVYRQPGFVTSRGDRVTVNVFDRASNIAIALQRKESCLTSDCPSNLLPITVRPGSAKSVVGSLEVSGNPPPRLPSQFRLDVSNLEAGLEIVDANGRAVKPDTLFPLQIARTTRFDIVRGPNWKPRRGSPAAAPEATVKAVAVAPLEGEAAVSFRVSPILPDVTLKYRGHDQDPSGARPLTAEFDALERSKHAFDFYVENALELPRPSNFTAQFDNSALVQALVGTDLRIPPPRDNGPSGYAFAVHPRLSWYCKCFLGLGLMFGASPDVALNVTYDPRDGRAPASAVASMHLDTENWRIWHFWSGCGWLFFVVLLLLYILWVARNLFLAAERFPREARFYIFEVGRNEPVGKHVRNSLWSDIWTALTLRKPRHRYQLDGLIVEADGGALRMRSAGGEWPNYEYRRRAKPLQEVAEEMTKRGLAPRPADAIIQAHWDDVIQQPTDDGRRIVFVKNYARRPQTATLRDVNV